MVGLCIAETGDEYLAGALNPDLESRGFGALVPSFSKRASAALGITPE